MNAEYKNTDSKRIRITKLGARRINFYYSTRHTCYIYPSDKLTQIELVQGNYPSYRVTIIVIIVSGKNL